MFYTISGFLDKNKDVQQDQLFEYMRDSKSPFVRDVTRFQVRQKTLMETEAKVGNMTA